MGQRYGNHDAIEPRVAGDGVAPADGATSKLPKALRVCLGSFVALCVATSLTHVLMVFLQVAPGNPISQRFSTQTDAWIQPWFDQSWAFFAPNPETGNAQIFARTVPAAANGAISDWFDISAADRADIRHNPYPSQTTQNMLLMAWELYQDTHGDDDKPDESALLQETYLRNIALQRVAAHNPYPIQSFQVKVVTHWIAASVADKSAKTDSTDPEIRILPWWKVTPDGS